MKPPWGFQSDFKKMLLIIGYSPIQDRFSQNHSETSMPTSWKDGHVTSQHVWICYRFKKLHSS